jgi:hypothetical protein
MRNHEVTTVQPLLNKDGSLREPGWSRRPVQIYDRKVITAPKIRIKEWDYYIILAKDYGIGLTVSDNGYVGLQSVTLFDFTKPEEITNTILNAFPLGKLRLPTSSTGNTSYHDKRLDIDYIVTPGKRHILCEFKEFTKGIDPVVRHHAVPAGDGLHGHRHPVVRGHKKAFYYNQKINCMRAEGVVRYDGREYVFSPKPISAPLTGDAACGPTTTWYWGSGNGLVEGKPFGFNIGYGFGNTAAATENILIYDGCRAQT